MKIEEIILVARVADFADLKERAIRVDSDGDLLFKDYSEGCEGETVLYPKSLEEYVAEREDRLVEVTYYDEGMFLLNDKVRDYETYLTIDMFSGLWGKVRKWDDLVEEYGCNKYSGGVNAIDNNTVFTECESTSLEEDRIVFLRCCEEVGTIYDDEDTNTYFDYYTPLSLDGEVIINIDFDLLESISIDEVVAIDYRVVNENDIDEQVLDIIDECLEEDHSEDLLEVSQFVLNDINYMVDRYVGKDDYISLEQHEAEELFLENLEEVLMPYMLKRRGIANMLDSLPTKQEVSEALLNDCGQHCECCGEYIPTYEELEDKVSEQAIIINYLEDKLDRVSI